MTNTEMEQICDYIVLNPKFNTVIQRQFANFFFQSNDKF